MQDILTYVATIKRPPVLIRAAKEGTRTYQRQRHLTRLLGLPGPAKSGEALIQIVEAERELNRRRQQGDASYSAMDHVDLMVALIAEVDLLKAARAV